MATLAILRVASHSTLWRPAIVTVPLRRFGYFLAASWLGVVGVASSGCATFFATRRHRVDLLVVAPHPDDEVLMAAGLLRQRLASGAKAAVVILTNGDATCERNGYKRQAESVAGLGELGLRESDVHFLGYPDGYLSHLGSKPLHPLPRRDPFGTCIHAAHTYGVHGAGHRDEHSARTGQAAPYTASALTGDLVAVLQRLQPREVVVPHPIDDHPDHAFTYAFFRRALDQIGEDYRDFGDRPGERKLIVHRAVVHAGPCWPGDCRRPYQPNAEIPALPSPHAHYVARERIAIDAQQKMLAIAHHASQSGPQPCQDWLASFARHEEIFYPERLEYSWPQQRWLRRPLSDTTVRRHDLRFDQPARAVFMSVDPADREEWELAVGPNEVTLRHYERDVLLIERRWPHSLPFPFDLELRVETRPDDGALSEWTLYTAHGWFGQEVLMSLSTMRLATMTSDTP